MSHFLTRTLSLSFTSRSPMSHFFSVTSCPTPALFVSYLSFSVTWTVFLSLTLIHLYIFPTHRYFLVGQLTSPLISLTHFFTIVSCLTLLPVPDISFPFYLFFFPLPHLSPTSPLWIPSTPLLFQPILPWHSLLPYSLFSINSDLSFPYFSIRQSLIIIHLPSPLPYLDPSRSLIPFPCLIL